MATITRKDGVQFIIPDFRERLVNKKTSLLKSEVSILAKSYGNLIHIHKNQDDSLDVAFSDESGFLLAESISKHLKSFDNFVYIEEIKYSNKIVFIVVKDGSVYRDSEIISESLHDELAILQTEQTKFDFYVFGNASVTNNQNEEFKFYVGDIAGQYTVLESSAIDALPRYEEYELVKVNLAFKRAELVKDNNKKVVLITAAAVLAIVWLLWPSSENNEVKQNIRTELVTVKSQFYDYAQAMKVPDPKFVIANIVNFTTLLYDLPAGWKLNSINATANTIKAVISNPYTVKNYEVLHQWTSSKNIAMTINSTNVSLSYTIASPLQNASTSIYPIDDVLRTLLDRIKPVLGNNSSINIGSKDAVENYFTQQITINFGNMSGNGLNTLAAQFTGLPIQFNASMLATSQTGLYSGSITITLIGD